MANVPCFRPFRLILDPDKKACEPGAPAAGPQSHNGASSRDPARIKRNVYKHGVYCICFDLIWEFIVIMYLLIFLSLDMIGCAKNLLGLNTMPGIDSKWALNRFGVVTSGLE